MRDIKGYEGIYAITSCGKVYSYRRKKFLKIQKQKTGYLMVILQKDRKIKNCYVHRLVAEVYLPNPNNYSDVTHKNKDKTKNYVNNLEWCTHSYNLNYGTRIPHRYKAVYCVELNKTFNSLKEAAQAFSLSYTNLSSCLNGRLKTFAGYHWKYA